MKDSKLIELLLTFISGAFSDGVYKDMLLFTEIHNESDMSLYQLVIKGERDKNTPFYCGAMFTHIIKEDYCDGECVYASILFAEKH